MQSSSQTVTANKSTPSFLQARCPSCRPTNSVKALKGMSLNALKKKQIYHENPKKHRVDLQRLKSSTVKPMCNQRRLQDIERERESVKEMSALTDNTNIHSNAN